MIRETIRGRHRSALSIIDFKLSEPNPQADCLLNILLKLFSVLSHVPHPHPKLNYKIISSDRNLN